ncbi:hypothetical protein ACQ33O_02420 [Ferruginibacter sp. SUN002]|uniref:hypothetical protein n=1 Tax=Ferruginibacter sp. SUN002 TaxID=2937789 RepID=UPI003D36C660
MSILKNSRVKALIKICLIYAIAGLIGGVGGFIYGMFEKINYQSKLTFALDEGGSGSGSSGGIAGIAAQFGLSIGGTSNDVFGGDNIAEIMKSRRMVERVLLSVDTFNSKATTLADTYTAVFGKTWKNKAGTILNITYPAGITKEKLNYLQDSILFCMYNSIVKGSLSATRPDKKLNIFEVNFKSPNERFTKIFTDRIVQETSQFYIELRTNKSKQTLDVLEQRVASLKGNLNSSISARASTQDANLNPAFAASQAPLQKQQVNIQVYGGAYGELYKNLELARYQFLKEIPLLQIIDNVEYPMQVVKTGKLKYAIYYACIAVLLTAIVMAIKKNIYAKVEG